MYTLAILLALCVASVLVLGLISMIRGNRQQSQLFMRLRVISQLAVLVILGAFFALGLSQ